VLERTQGHSHRRDRSSNVWRQGQSYIENYSRRTLRLLLYKNDTSPRSNISTGKVLRGNGAAPDFTIRASRRFFSRRRTLTKNFYASDAVSKLIPIGCAEKNSQ